jgi:hypothetical protein
MKTNMYDRTSFRPGFLPEYEDFSVRFFVSFSLVE